METQPAPGDAAQPQPTYEAMKIEFALVVFSGRARLSDFVSRGAIVAFCFALVFCSIARALMC